MECPWVVCQGCLLRLEYVEPSAKSTRQCCQGGCITNAPQASTVRCTCHDVGAGLGVGWGGTETRG